MNENNPKEKKYGNPAIDSPNEFMTEEMYRNIIRQSLNPNDISLKKDFEKQFEQRKAEIRQNSVVNTSI